MSRKTIFEAKTANPFFGLTEYQKKFCLICKINNKKKNLDSNVILLLHQSKTRQPDREEEEEGGILSLLTAKLLQPVGLMDCKNGGKVIRNAFRTTEADVSYRTNHNAVRSRGDLAPGIRIGGSMCVRV